MSDELNLRSKVYWRRLGWGVSLGLFAAIGALVFNTIVDRSIDLVWPNPRDGNRSPVHGTLSLSWRWPVLSSG